MRDLGNKKAAGGWQPRAALLGGEACVPHNHSTRSEAALQEAIISDAERASDHARRLAARHLAQAERFLGEAERLKALARALEASEAAQ